MVDLALVRRSGAVPEEEPLQALVAFELVLEPELVVLVRELEQVQQLGARLHDGERWGLRVVDQDGDAAVGVEAQEPLFLLLVGHYVDHRRRPLRAVRLGEFFQQDLHFLPVGGRLRDEVQALCVLDLVGRFGDVEMVRHGRGCC